MVRGSARAHCDSGYWPAKEGRTRFLSMRTLLRTPRLALSLSFSSALRIPDDTTPVYRAASPRRIRDFSPSVNRLSVSVRLEYHCLYKSDASSSFRRRAAPFLERTSVSYIQHCETFLHPCRGITLLSPVLNLLPRVTNLILV